MIFMSENFYACIDLKSFYASVECVERGLDPFKANLVVADPARGERAICLAVSPALKELGVPNRCRTFQIPDGIEYITALPRMKLYMKYSADIYSIYLKYISRDDIHVYSIDECFIDLTPYLDLYNKTAKEMVVLLMDAVFKETGICATAGIGTNMFLAKVALDVTAKHVDDHIGFLDLDEFKKTIWHHKPITDIWNIGRGIANRLQKYGVSDLYGVAHMDEKILYKEFGVNAEYLIDHSHGIEPCTIKEIHEYKSKGSSISNSQVLFEDYSFEDALVVLKEMVDLLSLELTEKHLVSDSISLYIGYSKSSAKSTGGTRKLYEYTNTYSKLAACFEEFYLSTAKHNCPIRRITVGVNNVVEDCYIQMNLFDEALSEKERKAQEAVLQIKNKFGKNAVLRGISLEEKATGRMRNKLIGGHNGE